MLLEAVDGTRLVLSPVGYQYPGLKGAGAHDWDANWLLIRGLVELPDGRTHEFVDPCLTTWEAASLGGWLGALMDGSLAPSDGDTVDCHFTEPCLGFKYMGVEGESLRLRVYLSLEAEPPFILAGQPGLFSNYVPLVVHREALASALRAWKEELARTRAGLQARADSRDVLP